MPQRLVTSQEVTRFFETNEGATIAAAAAHFGVSVATIKNRKREAGGRTLRLGDMDVRVFKFLVEFISEYGWAPSITEIQDGIDCSRSSAHSSLHRLHVFGAIEMGDGARTVRVTGSRVDMTGVPDEPR